MTQYALCLPAQIGEIVASGYLCEEIRHSDFLSAAARSCFGSEAEGARLLRRIDGADFDYVFDEAHRAVRAGESQWLHLRNLLTTWLSSSSGLALWWSDYYSDLPHTSSVEEFLQYVAQGLASERGEVYGVWLPTTQRR